MLSYRHGFHAGNHADVLKHLVLCRVLAHLTAKAKPLCCIDTHAGGGLYDLAGAQATMNREFTGGIARLLDADDAPPPLADYLDLVRGLNPDGELRCYPGSPWLARHWLREADRLVLCELHPAEFEVLRGNFGGDRRIRLLKADGLASLKGLLPPRERRGLVLVDPSYEIKTDYDAVVTALRDGHRRFATGCYALWYPVVSRRRIDRLERALVASGIRDIGLYELCVAPDGDGQGMTGSGMVLVNPPWTLAGEMTATLPWLAARLGGPGADWRVRTLVPE